MCFLVLKQFKFEPGDITQGQDKQQQEKEREHFA